MSIYVPTYLYVKHHSVTGLKYFGMTTRTDPIKYLGSGKYWRSHTKKHGVTFVETLWLKLFDTQELLTDFALLFSEHWDIANSNDWANLIPENGVGGVRGLVHSDESKLKMSLSKLGIPTKPHSAETKLKMSISHKGKIHSPEHVEKIAATKRGIPQPIERNLLQSIATKGIPKPILMCPHCNKVGGIPGIYRWHFNNCKLRV